MERRMHWTRVGGGFEFGLMLGGNSGGHANVHIQLCNASRRLSGHVLFNVNLHAFQIQIERLCGNAHDGGDARGQRGARQISWGKRFALAVIVGGGVGDQRGCGRTVNGAHAQVTKIFAGDFY